MLGPLAAALVFVVAAPAADTAAPARADANATKRYTLAITVTIVRAAAAYQPGGEDSGHWQRRTTWKASSRYPFLITRIGSGTKLDYRFVARIAGQLAAHKGTGEGLLRGTQFDCWIPMKDIAPASAQFAGTFNSVGVQLVKLKNGKLQRQIGLSFMPGQPLRAPDLRVSLSATPCNQAMVVPGQAIPHATLPVPTSWRSRTGAAKISFGHAFTLKLSLDRTTTPSLYQEVPGGWVDDQVTWTLRFKPAPAA